MAKGQKRSNRETRKPKQEKPKPMASSHSFLSSIEQPKPAHTGPKHAGPRPH
jgi:hypothetical protein